MKPEYIVTEIRNLLGIDIGIDVSEYEDHTAVCFYKKDAEVIIEALEKQVAKKPINDKCENCGEDVRNWTGDDNFKYCPNCGQRIDWGNEE